MNLPKEVVICEVGPRDGLQNEDKVIPVDEKVQLINKLSDSGYQVIEAADGKEALLAIKLFLRWLQQMKFLVRYK